MKKYLILSLPVLLFACNRAEEVPNTSFTKIYDHSNYNLDFRPLDIEGMADGYMILSTTVLDRSQFPGIQLVQVKEQGEFDAGFTFSADLVAPTSDLHLVDSTFYFFAMDPVGLRVNLVSFDTGFGNINIVPLNAPVYYPLSSSLASDGQFLLLSYDPEDKLSVLSKVDVTGSVTSLAGYSIGPGSDAEEAIIDHYLQPDEKALPFFCGEVSSSLFYFNGFFNYSLSLVFSDFGEEPTGVVQGQFTDAGIRNLLPVNAGTFALSGYQFEDNFLYPSVSLNTTGISSTVDLYTSNAAEWKPYTPVAMEEYSLEGIDYIVYAAETKSRQIALYFYQKQSGNFAGLTHIGYANPFTLSALHVDDENHLLVLGTTYVAGRFERIFLEKMQQETLLKIVQ